MKRRKGLFAVVAALAVSSVMAAMAYNSGYVHNTQQFKVADTQSALLAVIPQHVDEVGYKDVTARDVNGKVVFKFGAGSGDTMYGLQPSSQYVWNDLIKVQNNSKDNISVKLVASGELAKYLVVTDLNGNVVFDHGKAMPFILNSTTSRNFNFDIVVPQGADYNAKADDTGLVLYPTPVQ